jgi:hypothetical protein
MTRALLSLVSACCLVLPLAAGAQGGASAVPSMIAAATDNGLGQPSRTWSITSAGSVTIGGERCRGCRWHAPYHRTYRVDPARYREIEALIDVAVLRAAAAAPCAVPRTDFVTPAVEFTFSNSRAGINETVRLRMHCVSPAMDAARDRLNRADAIISAIDAQRPAPGP